MILDLFAGLKGASAAFEKRGHRVITLDWLPRFGCTITADILKCSVKDRKLIAPDGTEYGPFDFAFAGCPCERYSVAAIGKHWTMTPTGLVPKEWENIEDPKERAQAKRAHEGAVLAQEIVRHTINLLEQLAPTYGWIIENPRGALRKMAFMRPYSVHTVHDEDLDTPTLEDIGHSVDFERVTVSYCQYGETNQKMTDLWGIFPPGWRPRPICKARANVTGLGILDPQENVDPLPIGTTVHAERGVVIATLPSGEVKKVPEDCAIYVLTPDGQPCHEAAPRGALAGVQGKKGADTRAEWPVELSLELCLALERIA